MSLLTDRQKLEFKRTGFLSIPDAVDADLIEEAHELIWESIPAERDDPASYVGGEGHLSAWEHVPEDRRDVFAAIDEQVYAYAEAMAGEVLEPPGDRVQLSIRHPEDQQTLERFEAPSTGHIDGYDPGFNEDGTVHGFSIGAAVYYDRVELRGGGSTVWPGSHYTVAEYYASHVMETPGHAHHDGVPADLGAPFESPPTPAPRSSGTTSSSTGAARTGAATPASPRSTGFAARTSTRSSATPPTSPGSTGPDSRA